MSEESRKGKIDWNKQQIPEWWLPKAQWELKHKYKSDKLPQPKCSVCGNLLSRESTKLGKGLCVFHR